MRPKHMTNKELGVFLRKISEVEYGSREWDEASQAIEEAAARLIDDDLREHYAEPKRREQPPVIDAAYAIKGGLENVTSALNDIGIVLNELLIEKRGRI